jgi:hypothetical protein
MDLSLSILYILGGYLDYVFEKEGRVNFCRGRACACVCVYIYMSVFIRTCAFVFVYFGVQVTVHRD